MFGVIYPFFLFVNPLILKSFLFVSHNFYSLISVILLFYKKTAWKPSKSNMSPPNGEPVENLSLFYWKDLYMLFSQETYKIVLQAM